MRVLYNTRGLPTLQAPFGDEGKLGTAKVEADLDDAGVLWINGQQYETATEGDQPGQWETRSGLTLAQLDQLRTAFQALASDSDPAVRTAVRAARASLDGTDAQAIATLLLGVATDSAGRTSAERVDAIQSLASIVAKELGI